MKNLYFLVAVLVGFFSGCDRRHYTYITNGTDKVVTSTVTIEIPVVVPSTTTIVIIVPSTTTTIVPCHPKHPHEHR